MKISSNRSASTVCLSSTGAYDVKLTANAKTSKLSMPSRVRSSSLQISEPSVTTYQALLSCAILTFSRCRPHHSLSTRPRRSQAVRRCWLKEIDFSRNFIYGKIQSNHHKRSGPRTRTLPRPMAGQRHTLPAASSFDLAHCISQSECVPALLTLLYTPDECLRRRRSTEHGLIAPM